MRLGQKPGAAGVDQIETRKGAKRRRSSMSSKLIKVRPEICDYSSQPRSQLGDCRSLGENMKAIGQQVPIIGHTDPKSGRFIVADGGRRLQAAILCGIPELLALDVGRAPTPLELKMEQASIDSHKQHFLVMDRARLWDSIKELRGCTARQLATELGVSDSLVGDYLSLLTLPADVQELVNSGALNLSKALVIAQQESDPVRQRELAALAGDISRSQLAAKVKENRRDGQETSAVRLSRIKVAMPDATLVISGKDLTMAGVVNLLTQTLQQARKAADQYDVKTWVRMMADKAKAR
jgi:ParB family transcriptional regulator, chromosome partitioning protein